MNNHLSKLIQCSLPTPDYVGVAVLFFRFSGGLLRSCSVLGLRFLCLNKKPNSRLLLLKRIGKKHRSPWIMKIGCGPAPPGVRLSGSSTAWLWKSSWKHLKSPCLGPKVCSSVFHVETRCPNSPGRAGTGHGYVIYIWGTWLRACMRLSNEGYFLWEKRGPDFVYPVN